MKDFKKILSVFALTTFVIIALGFLASNANAQSDCDDEGITGAAYGLCTAYCEAMDCDRSDDGPYASDNACQRVSDNFNRITGGEDLPCEACGGWQCQ